MAITIARMQCVVRVTTGESHPLQHGGQAPDRPSLEYAMPMAEHTAETGPVPNRTATEGRGPASGKSPISPSKVDPRKVTDRVYELMKQEIRMGQMRGGS